MLRMFPLLILAASSILDAQMAEGRMSGPLLGYVFDSTAESLRPILGIPGAATLGDPLDLGRSLASAAISPQQDYFLAVAQQDQEVLLGRLEAEQPSVTPILEARRGAERIALSPTGNWAALYHRGVQRIQLIAGLPLRPTLTRDLDLSALPGSLNALAISDAGLVLVSVGEAGSLVGFDDRGESRYLAAAGQASSIAFLENRDDAVVADRSANTVAVIRNVTGVVEWIPLATEKDGISAPRAVEVSSDNRRAFVANSGRGDVVILDLTGGVLSRLSCPCAVSGFERLKGPSRFRLTPVTEAPLWVLDGDTEEARVVFVPRLSGLAEASAVSSGRRE